MSTKVNKQSNSKFVEAAVAKKKVHFNEAVKLQTLHVYLFANKIARQCYWETVARDNERFKRRIAQCMQCLGDIFSASHRRKIFNERFKKGDRETLKRGPLSDEIEESK